MDLFSLYVLFSHFRPRDFTLENSFFQMSSYARAYVCITHMVEGAGWCRVVLVGSDDYDNGDDIEVINSALCWWHRVLCRLLFANIVSLLLGCTNLRTSCSSLLQLMIISILLTLNKLFS